jgi:hypothetical protein
MRDQFGWKIGQSNVAEARSIDKKSPFPRWTPYRRRHRFRLPEKFRDFVVGFASRASCAAAFCRAPVHAWFVNRALSPEIH